MKLWLKRQWYKSKVGDAKAYGLDWRRWSYTWIILAGVIAAIGIVVKEPMHIIAALAFILFAWEHYENFKTAEKMGILHEFVAVQFGIKIKDLCKKERNQ